jgi:hypothetical protein
LTHAWGYTDYEELVVLMAPYTIMCIVEGTAAAATCLLLTVCVAQDCDCEVYDRASRLLSVVAEMQKDLRQKDEAGVCVQDARCM